MIISDTKKFIFVHVPKTGGMSVRKVLGKYATVGVWQHPFRIRQKNSELRKHAFARTIAKYVQWDKYYSFGFVRNPWAWAVSMYFYIRKDRNDPRHKRAQQMDFTSFVTWMHAWDPKDYPIIRGQKNYLSDSTGNLMVTRICRLETFSEDLSKVCSKLHVPYTRVRENTTSHARYQTYYTEAARKTIGKLFEKDVDEFRYVWKA